VGGLKPKTPRPSSPSLTTFPLPPSLAIRFNSNQGHHDHETESFEAFNARYQQFFNSCTDLFELQRGLNNCFAYDLVPTTDVIEAALKCARKVNDYAITVRILEGLKFKVENKGQYEAYLKEMDPLLKELGELISPDVGCESVD
jgi:cytochrome c oxidase subunit 5a